MDLTSIGRNIRKYRKEKGMMQDTLAEMTDLSANYIGMIERGEKIPALPTLIKIANALEHKIQRKLKVLEIVFNRFHK